MNMPRRAVPTPLLKLRGSYNPTQHGKGRRFEPKPEGDLDEPPPDLTDSQEAVWRYAIAHMPRGVMKKIDRDMLMLWCEARDRWNTARLMQALLDRDMQLKLLVKGQFGLEASPYHDILDKTAKIMIRIAQELGFSPAARPRLQAEPQGEPEDAVTDDPWRLLENIPGAIN